LGHTHRQRGTPTSDPRGRGVTKEDASFILRKDQYVFCFSHVWQLFWCRPCCPVSCPEIISHCQRLCPTTYSGYCYCSTPTLDEYGSLSRTPNPPGTPSHHRKPTGYCSSRPSRGLSRRPLLLAKGSTSRRPRRLGRRRKPDTRPYSRVWRHIGCHTRPHPPWTIWNGRRLSLLPHLRARSWYSCRTFRRKD
jgi:hypothetical protein